MSTTDEKIAQFVRLREYKKMAKSEFDEGMKRVNEGLAKLEAELIDDLNKAGVQSVTGGAGTAYKIKRTSVSVKDRDEFIRFVAVNKLPDAMDIRANKKVIEEILSRGVAVPGVNYTEVIQLGIRRGKSNV